jgi:hypothetical protein
MRPVESVVCVLGQVCDAIQTFDLRRGMNTVVPWMGAGTAMFADEVPQT